jgi:hypothetical protein
MHDTGQYEDDPGAGKLRHLRQETLQQDDRGLHLHRKVGRETVPFEFCKAFVCQAQRRQVDDC